MTIQLPRWIITALVAAFAICGPHAATGEDRLIWHARGPIQSISSDTLTINRFQYKLTGSTVYEKNDRQTSWSSFGVGDYVQVTFLTDRSALKVETDDSRENTPSRTPTPVATPDVKKLSARLASLGDSRAKGESNASYGETESKFIVQVRIPRNSIPLATTEAEAKALSVKTTITRDGELVARCTAPFQPKRRKRFVFEYKTEVERKGRTGATRARSRKGRCILANGSVGLPSVRSGDLVTVSEATAGEFLKGDF